MGGPRPPPAAPQPRPNAHAHAGGMAALTMLRSGCKPYHDPSPAGQAGGAPAAAHMTVFCITIVTTPRATSTVATKK